ncbi:PKD domain-containing protein [Chloroflexota bacterium]
MVKTDSASILEWEKTFGGTGYEDAYYVQQTTDGGYFIAGWTNSFGAGSYDAYLVKTDNLGNVEWEKTFGSASYEWAYSAQQTSDGGYIVGGMIESYDPMGDYYLFKVDAYGSLEWEKSIGSSYCERGESVCQTADGGYVIVGGAYDAINDGFDEVYCVKTDEFGNIEWEKTITGTRHKYARYVQQTNDGGYVITGQTDSFGAGYSDIYLVKLAPDVPPEPPVADAGGPYLTQVNVSVDLDGSASYDPDGTIVSYDWNYGDETTGSGIIAPHTYTEVGIYDVELTVTDNDNAQDSDTAMAVVYDPESGRATGGGWIWSEPGNFASEPESEGKATFGFIMRYKQDAPDGNLEFQYHVGDINLKDTEITWLVVSNASAQFQGVGTINGEGLYTFRVLAKDGNKAGGQPDEFTIKIWEGTDTEADPIYKALNVELGGGSIIVHNK